MLAGCLRRTSFAIILNVLRGKGKDERSKSTVVDSIVTDVGEKWAAGRCSWKEKGIHRNTHNYINASSPPATRSTRGPKNIHMGSNSTAEIHDLIRESL